MGLGRRSRAGGTAMAARPLRRGARDRWTARPREPVRSLPLAVPRHDEEPQPALVLHGGLRDRREDGALRGAPARAPRSLSSRVTASPRQVLEPDRAPDRAQRGYRGGE